MFRVISATFSDDRALVHRQRQLDKIPVPAIWFRHREYSGMKSSAMGACVSARLPTPKATSPQNPHSAASGFFRGGLWRLPKSSCHQLAGTGDRVGQVEIAMRGGNGLSAQRTPAAPLPSRFPRPLIEYPPRCGTSATSALRRPPANRRAVLRPARRVAQRKDGQFFLGLNGGKSWRVRQLRAASVLTNKHTSSV